MRARWPWAALLAWACALASCSLLVREGSTGAPCQVEEGAEEDGDPCPGDQRCIEGTCRRPGEGCKPNNDGQEICNGIDDDCDGEIDEGHDSDGDGVTWCGGGVMEDADCDDFDARTNPQANEVCDGRDNDCDGETDEETGEARLCPGEQECVEQRCVAPSCLFEGSSSGCPAGTRCSASGECVRGSGCGPESCASNEVCDEASNSCVEVGKANGQACAADEECASHSCVDAAALRMQSDGRVCGSSCCSDADCGSDEFCFASGSGARSCLPLSMDPRGDNYDEVCTASEGCGERDLCARQSGVDVEGSGFEERRDLTLAMCGEEVGRLHTGELCTMDEQCETGLCEFPICSVPCGSSEECRTTFRSDQYYCRTKESGFLSRDYVSSCVLDREEHRDGRQGDSCRDQTDCAEAGCVMRSGGREGGFCADACCNDRQCAEGTTCRPLAFGAHYEMRCVP